MRRKRKGIAGIQRHAKSKASYEDKGKALAQQQAEKVMLYRQQFQALVMQYGVRHRKEIQGDPHIKEQYRKLCALLDVSVLQVENTGMGRILRGQINYKELSLWLVTYCKKMEDWSGGLYTVEVILEAFHKQHPAISISQGDIEKSIRELGILGNEFGLEVMNGEVMVRSVALECDKDTITVLAFAHKNGGKIGLRDGAIALQWTVCRLKNAMDILLATGMCWLDMGGRSPPSFYFGFSLSV